eukprot:3595454-Alexandrium_andersonii.AAC.1
MAERMGLGRLEAQRPPFAGLLAEAVRSGWSGKDVSRVLCVVSRRCRRPFFATARRLEPLFRGHDSLVLLRLALERYTEVDGSA